MTNFQVKVPFDSNKLYASEILSILLQNEPNNRLVFFSSIFSSNLDSILIHTVKSTVKSDVQLYVHGHNSVKVTHRVR